MALPVIPEHDAEEIDAPLHATKLVQELKGLESGKSPGPDGFPPCFYKIFAPSLAPVMVNAFKAINGSHPLSPSLPQAQIAVIPKPGKNYSICGNYRPISLLNVDFKLFFKILTNCLSPLLPDLIHGDQVDFVPEREA